MAKDTMKNINQPTVKATQVTEKTEDKKKKEKYPISVYLPEGDRDYITDLAKRLKVSRHSLMQFAIKLFIDQHKNGNIEIPVKPANEIDF